METYALILVAIGIVALIIGVARYLIVKEKASLGKAIFIAIIFVVVGLGFCGIRLF